MAEKIATISLAQALEVIDSGKMFDIEYCTADRNRGTGGVLKAFKGVCKFTNPERGKRTEAREGAKHKRPAISHKWNSTLNIWVPAEPDPKKRIKTVHIRLITLFNGKEVI